VSFTEATPRVVGSKGEEGERLPALSPALVDVLEARYAASPFKADTDFVFAHPQTGARFGADRYREFLHRALLKADIRAGCARSSDARHAALTHQALTPGMSELVLMATAGHRSFSTTRRYLHQAGRAFPEAAAALEDRLLAGRKFYPSELISADLSGSETTD
jgi:integrase